MKLSIGRNSIKFQLVILISTAVILMITVQLFYYYKFYFLTQKKTEEYSTNILNQVDEKLNSINQDIEEVAFTVSYNSDLQEYMVMDDLGLRLEKSRIVSNLLGYITTSNKNIINLRVIDLQQRYIDSPQEDPFGVPLEFSKICDDLISTEFKENIFLGVFYDEVNAKYYYAFANPIFSILSGENPMEKKGICVVLCKTDYIKKIIADISMTQNSEFIIVDNNNRVIAANGLEKQGDIFTGIDFNEIQSQNRSGIYYKGRNCIIQYKIEPKTRWKVISIIPLSELTRDMNGIKNFGLTIGFMMIILLIIIGALISRSITKPVSGLIRFMESISKGKTRKRLEISNKNEVGILAQYINSMLNSLEEITQRMFKTQTALYEAELARTQIELEKKHAELWALQNQINPHFLYNTLECIRSIGVVHDILEIEQIASSLAKMFRYSIKSDEFVNTSDEINCIKEYLNIISIRFMNRFSYHIEMDDDLKNKKILKMILQPIIENAIYHGLECKDGPGEVKIRGMLDPDNIIHFIISDDGIGIDKDELDRVNAFLSDTIALKSSDENKKGIGIININNRIKLIYGTQYGIKIQSIKDEGTTVIINFPADH